MRLDGVRVELAAGSSLWAIAGTYWSAWGYKNQNSAYVALLGAIPKPERPADGRTAANLRRAKARSEARFGGARTQVVVRLYEAGISRTAIAGEAWTLWGYGSQKACETGLYRALRQSGIRIDRSARLRARIPDLNRGEALALIQEAA